MELDSDTDDDETEEEGELAQSEAAKPPPGNADTVPTGSPASAAADAEKTGAEGASSEEDLTADEVKIAIF